jgi:transposase-like protein
MVAAPPSSPSRWQRGIRRPDEIKLAALAALLEREPGMSKAELCRKSGIGRSTLPYYIRHIREAVAEAASRNEEARERIALTHVDLVARMNRTAVEVRADLDRLRASKATASPAVIFSGVRALVQVERLLGELLGEIQPPTQNTYVLQVAALLDRPVELSTLSATSRAVLEGGEVTVAQGR